MGEYNSYNRLATTCFPIPYQWDRLDKNVNQVMLPEPSPISKKRPATAGLFLLYFIYSLSSLASHNIRGFAQPRLAEVANTALIGEAQR